MPHCKKAEERKKNEGKKESVRAARAGTGDVLNIHDFAGSEISEFFPATRKWVLFVKGFLKAHGGGEEMMKCTVCSRVDRPLKYTILRRTVPTAA